MVSLVTPKAHQGSTEGLGGRWWTGTDVSGQRRRDAATSLALSTWCARPLELQRWLSELGLQNIAPFCVRARVRVRVAFGPLLGLGEGSMPSSRRAATGAVSKSQDPVYWTSLEYKSSCERSTDPLSGFFHSRISSGERVTRSSKAKVSTVPTQDFEPEHALMIPLISHCSHCAAHQRPR